MVLTSDQIRRLSELRQMYWEAKTFDATLLRGDMRLTMVWDREKAVEEEILAIVLGGA